MKIPEAKIITVPLNDIELGIPNEGEIILIKCRRCKKEFEKNENISPTSKDYYRCNKCRGLVILINDTCIIN